MYQSLYRKYRPNKFVDLCGQKAIIKILKNSINNNKISHAYMFSGPRGTGKTSTAKIFANTVNCLNLKNGEACGKCDNCIEISSGTAVDIIEIDAASNNGVDEIRELRNNINLSCASLKYKVYIIDEVHMLSTGAFNALLKTLEEPPEHVIFILATTDPQKVPATIVSRCQCYSFSQISVNDIVEKLQTICEKEKFVIGDDILEKIAIFSNGGMRDAIGLLEKVSLFGKNISLNDFYELCGYVSDEDIEKFISSITHNDRDAIVDIIDSKYASGMNLIVFFNQVIQKLDKLMKNSIDDPILTQKYVRYIVSVNKIIIELKSSDNPSIVASALALTSLIDKDSNVEDVGDNNFIAGVKNEQNETKKTFEINNNFIEEKKDTVNNIVSKQDVLIDNDIIINNTFATASKDKIFDMRNNWHKFNDFVLDRDYGSNVSFLLDAELCAVGEETMIVSFEYKSLVDRAMNMYEDLKKTISHVLKIDIDIAFITAEDWKKIKQDYIDKIKNGYVFKKIDKQPIIVTKNIENSDKSSTEVREADIIFGDDIVEYE